MNYLLLALVILVALLLVKNLKHHFARQSFRAVIIILIFLAGLFIASYYFNVADLFAKNSVLVQTGAAVKETIGEKLEDKPILEGEKLKELSESTLNTLKNSEIARKLYK